MAVLQLIMCTHDLKVPLSMGAYVFIMCACMPYLVDHALHLDGQELLCHISMACAASSAFL